MARLEHSILLAAVTVWAPAWQRNPALPVDACCTDRTEAASGGMADVYLAATTAGVCRKFLLP
jgi:hypothetical protein